MELRKLNNENKDDFHKTYITALTEGFVDFVPYKWISKFDSEFNKYLEELMADETNEKLICYLDNKSIGVVIYGKSTVENAKSDDALLDSIYFKKSFYGQGFAQKALEYAENDLIDKGYKKVFLWCSKENKRAWHFYLKNGYVPTEKKWDDLLDGKTFHNILFEKDLKDK